MARGTVKDPAGHQSPGHSFGYIQRVPETIEEYNDLKWPGDCEQMKVIPYNQEKYELQIGDEVNFDVEDAEVYFKGEPIGTIGIAENVVVVEKRK